MFKWWQKIARAHRSDDETERGEVMEFFFPQLKKGFFIRLAVEIAIALITFTVFLTPCIIDGKSMMPTYGNSGFTFCKRWSYWFSTPQRGDIVIINYAPRVYLLKRVIALEGDTVEFRNGILFVNGKQADEPYLRYLSTWNLKPRKVAPGKCYVVGDNRSQHIEEHIFGQIDTKRIIGEPLF